MLKEFLEAVLSRVAPSQFVLPDGVDPDRVFYDRAVTQAPSPRKPPVAETRVVSSLLSLSEYLEANRDGLDLEGHVLHIVSPARVDLLGPLQDYHRGREIVLSAVYPVNGSATLEKWTELDHGRIVLMSQFAPLGQREELLAALQKVVKEKLEVREDQDGTSQTLTVKDGVQSLGLKKITNPVMLAPFATFPEAGQIVRPFVFRMNGAAEFCLLPADGRAWEREAIAAVKRVLMTDFGVDLPVIG